MLLHQEDGALAIRAETYTLTFAGDRPFVYLDGPDGSRIAELFLLSSIHPLHDRDDTTRIAPLEVAETPDEVVFTIRAESSVWRAKTFRLRCGPRRLIYEVEVAGDARLAEANYFGGYCSALPRWGSGFFVSGSRFARGFTPEPNAEEQHYFAPNGGAVIDMTGVPLPGRGDWFFTPPPFCFAFEAAGGWLALGVEAAPGAHRFSEYRYHGGRGFHLSLSYEGHTRVDGVYRLPALAFDFAGDEFTALRAHCEGASRLYRTSGGKQAALTLQSDDGRQTIDDRYDEPQPSIVHRPSSIVHAPPWWREPIFCGWGAQCHIAAQRGGRAPEYARQELYEEFLATLAARDLSPGVVVLDDKWQATYGDNAADERKWPDLRGFIARQHAEGRKVLLWLKAWDPEGLPVEECIVNAAGAPLACDPSNPAFERRLRESVRRMLGADGYDADGFKIDFTARIPSGPGIRTFDDMWGLELMKLYLKVIYDEAKRVKPDALVMTHTPHPYLADVLDMVRLNDTMDLGLLPGGVIGRDLCGVMRMRARIAQIACPDAVIDCDNWPVPDRAAWREYVRAQPELGVPSLYFVSHVDLTGEPLDAEDYQLVKETWSCSRSSPRERP